MPSQFRVCSCLLEQATTGNSGDPGWGGSPQGWEGRGSAARKAEAAGTAALLSSLTQPHTELARLHPLIWQRYVGGRLCVGWAMTTAVEGDPFKQQLCYSQLLGGSSQESKFIFSRVLSSTHQLEHISAFVREWQISSELLRSLKHQTNSKYKDLFFFYLTVYLTDKLWIFFFFLIFDPSSLKERWLKCVRLSLCL